MVSATSFLNIPFNNMLRIVFVIVFSLCSSLSAYAVSSVELNGLFGKKSALLVIDGKQTVLKLDKTISGVTLIEVVDNGVVLDINGKRREVMLTQRSGSSDSGGYKPPETSTVRIASQRGGHYWVTGRVNGFSVEFVVDTGATTISMNAAMADRLGIDYNKGRLVQMSTANGLSSARLVSLQKVTVGEITQYNVEATVTLNNALPVVLLGNSFLSGVDMRTENGVLILESRL